MQIRKKQKGILGYASSSSPIDVLERGEYKGIVLDSSARPEWRGLDYGFGVEPIYRYTFLAVNFDKLTPEIMDRLAKKRQIEKEAFEHSYSTMPRTDYSVGLAQLIEGLEEILSWPETKELLKANGIQEDIPLQAVHTNPSTVAFYSSLPLIGINVDNDFVQYLASMNLGKKGSRYFVPVLGHELAHDYAFDHGNPFYDKSAILGQGLREIVAKRDANKA